VPDDFTLSYQNTASKFDFLNSPYSAIIGFALSRRPTLLPPEFISGVHSWKALGAELHNTSHQSIDEFARTNPGLNKVVKLLIALEIARVGFDKSSIKQNVLRVAPELTANARANWYGKLVAHLRRAHPTPEAFRSSPPLTVITFNYDRSLEDFLAKDIPRAEIYSDLEVREAVNIIHVHGLLEMTPPPGPSIPLAVHFGDCLLSSAKQFLVIDDKRGGQDPAAIARYYLDKADHIVTIGFDFHPANVELIGLNSPNVAAKCRTLNFAGSAAFDARAVRAGLATRNIMKDGKSFEISTAIDEGLFDF
jgi:hypothetical protein